MFSVVIIFHMVYVNLAAARSNDIESQKIVMFIPSGDEKARTIAMEYELSIVKRVFKEKAYYIFQERYFSNETKRRNLLQSIKTNKHVYWVKLEKPKIRLKRNVNYENEMQIEKEININDELWPKMWYVNPKFEIASDMNIYGAWQLGYSGKNVVATIIDDGIEKNNEELARNYDSEASYDINDDDLDPTPRYDPTNENQHGTRCAGEISGVANNGRCGVGIAYNSKIGGIRLLDGTVTDSTEAAALTYNKDHIDIYSASWGPKDDGKTVEGPGRLALEALKLGITYGRKGKGSIYVWASGNGGTTVDYCSCDGYVNSPYTITISSVTEKGYVPLYSEKCPAILAVTYSSGLSILNERSIVTADIRDSCTMFHSGTSASAPLAAGMIALALEANPSLTWRDVQYLIVYTSRPLMLKENWKVNGNGLYISEAFGFGLMNAYEMVKLAKNWQKLPPRRKCSVRKRMQPQIIRPRSKVTQTACSNACKDRSNAVNILEHIMVVLTINARRRGNISIFLISPSGTNVTLLSIRPRDNSTYGFNRWPFMSVLTWGENPSGCWTVEIVNNGNTFGIFSHFQLIFTGMWR